MSEETLIINTKTAYKTKRKFQCPYCTRYKGLRHELVDHIEAKHQSEIPEEWTAARVVYKVVNGKSEGKCLVCGQGTKWNEDRWGYDRLCGRDECRLALAAKYKARTKNKYGEDYNIYKDPEHQKKMLNGRRISGTYKFQDGGDVSYTGKYELERLKFMDTILGYKSWEIVSPGPVIEYMMDGVKHFWITDCYIISHNLVIDDKDGGAHPNTREMEYYRKKQIYKEKAIEEQKQYNYLRLTDKNFTQLLYALADIKSRMIDDDTDKKETYMYINENAAIMGAFPPDASQQSHVIVTPFMMKNTFTGENDTYIGLSKGYRGDMLYVDDNGNIKKKSSKEVHESYPCNIFHTTISIENFKKIEEDYMNNNIVDKYYLYETVTGKHLYDLDQLMFDPLLEKIDIQEDYKTIQAIEEATLRGEANKTLNGTDFSIDIFTDKELYKANRLLESNHNLIIRQDPKGYFVYNESTNRRSPSYIDIDLIPRSFLRLV